MSKNTARKSIYIGLLFVILFTLSGCFPKKIMADDTLQAPAPREITGRLYEKTVGQLLESPATVGEVWLLPTPTPVPSDLFDRVFGKAREIVPTMVAIPAQRKEQWGTVTVPALNVRSSPSAEADVIAGLTQEQRVKVEAQEDGWLQVALDDGRLGWSAADYIMVEELLVSLTETATPEPVIAASEKGVVLADSLNVRSLPNLSGNIVGSLMRYQCVDVIREQDGWFLLSLPDATTGWSTSDYIQSTDACPTPGAMDTAPVGNAAPASSGVQQIDYVEPTQEQEVHYSAQPMQVNATVVQESHMHECWGGGWDEVRFVSSNTPVEVLGTGPWTPPPGQEGKLGPGPYVKIRIWDGQYGWISESAVNVKADYVAKIAGVCEEGDRIDWSTIVRPTPRPTPRPLPTPRSVPTYRPSTTSTTINRPVPTARPVEHKYRDE